MKRRFVDGPHPSDRSPEALIVRFGRRQAVRESTVRIRERVEGLPQTNTLLADRVAIKELGRRQRGVSGGDLSLIAEVGSVDQGDGGDGSEISINTPTLGFISGHSGQKKEPGRNKVQVRVLTLQDVL